MVFAGGRLIAQPMLDPLRRWSRGAFDASGGDVPLAGTIRAMDDAGVRLGLCCAWWGPHGPLLSNDEVAAFVRAYPHRLVGVASVDLYQPMAAVRELRRCVRELGFRALRIVPWLWDLPPDDRRYYPLYASIGFAFLSDCAKEFAILKLDPVQRHVTASTWPIARLSARSVETCECRTWSRPAWPCQALG
jgi:hypothetical protein